MECRVKKWGNSLALRIPRVLAKQAGLEEDSSVQITAEEGKLVIAPTQRPRYCLEELMAQVTPGNLHKEVQSGGPVGGEVW